MRRKSLQRYLHRENIRKIRFKLTLVFAFRVIDMQFNQLDTQLTNLTRN